MVIQTKCIQTILFDSGRLSHYRLTLPILKTIPIPENARKYIFSKGNRTFYIREHSDYDAIIRFLKTAQLYIVTEKIKILEQRKKVIANQLSIL